MNRPVLFIDCEAGAPELGIDENRALINGRSNWKPETLEAKRNDPDALLEARHRLATDPRRAELCGAAWVVGDGTVEWAPGPSILDVVHDFRGAIIAGHNIDGYDIQLLAVTAARVRHPATARLWKILRAKPWDMPTRDTCKALTMSGAFGKVTWSVDDACRWLGLPGPRDGTFTGADVPGLWDAVRDSGDAEAARHIAEHAVDDVERERALYIELCRLGITDWGVESWFGGAA